MKKPIIGVIDVGGGQRDIYGSGVLDWCLDHDFNPDHCVGVSAGSANMATFLGRQPRRAMRFYFDYAFRKDYMSPANLIKKHSYIDFDYIYDRLSGEDGEDPLDYDAICDNPARLSIIATDAKTGARKIFEKADLARNHYEPLKASCAIPVACAPQRAHGRLYFDGGLSDPIPVTFGLENGWDKMILILTKPKTYRRPLDENARYVRLLRWRWPKSAEVLKSYAARYNAALEQALELEQSGRALILAPTEAAIAGMTALTKDREKLMGLYIQGYKDAAAIADFIRT